MHRTITRNITHILIQLIEVPFELEMITKLLLLAMTLSALNAQQLPENTCSAYFQYVTGNLGGYEGELRLSLQSGFNRIDVRFSQRDLQDQSVVGALHPYPDESTARAAVGAAKFRLKLLPNRSGLLPKLTRLAYNDDTLCTSSEYNAPNSYFNRYYILHTTRHQSQPRLSPSSVFNTYSTVQSDVEIKTLVFDATGDKELAQEAIPHLLGDWVHARPSDSATSWQPWTPATTSTTAAVVPWQFGARTTKGSFVTAAPTQWNIETSTTRASHLNQLVPKRAPSVPSPGSFKCGQEGNIAPFIQNGREYPRGTYPWLTAIYHKESFSLIFKCGGSLISTSLVITAAHCVYRIKEDRVVVGLGRYDLDNYNEDGAQVREVMNIKMHPEFTSRTQLQPDADIALVTLDRPVTFNDIIGPICLWEVGDSQIAADTGSIAGWGTDENGNAMTRYPHVVDAKIASEADCARTWKLPRILTRTLCAGNLNGSGPCLGDSGGGLMIKHNSRWILRGIVSQGQRSSVDVCNLNQYVLYSDISKHLNWITENIS